MSHGEGRAVGGSEGQHALLRRDGDDGAVGPGAVVQRARIPQLHCYTHDIDTKQASEIHEIIV